MIRYFIMRSPAKSNVSNVSTQRNQTSREPEPLPKPRHEYEEMRKLVVSKKSVDEIADEDLPHFVQYMLEYKGECLCNEEYIRAKDAAAIIDACKTEYTARRNKANSGNVQVCDANNAEKQRRDVQERLKKFDESTLVKLHDLQQRQKEEMEAFETKWREEMPEKYRRVPKNLIELRETARSLAFSGQYDEAALRKNEADALEAMEQKEAQIRLDRDYKVAKRRLLAQYKSEIDNFYEIRALKRDLYQTEFNNINHTEKNRGLVLKSKSQSNRSSALNSSYDGLTSSMRNTAPRKPVGRVEKKLPALRPPNESRK